MSLGYRKFIVGAQGNGPTLTAAASAPCLPTNMNIPFPGGYWGLLGQMLMIELQGKISNVVTTPGTARFDVRLGGTVVFDGLAVPLNLVAKVDVAFWLRIWLRLATVGPLASFHGWGKFESEAIVGSPLPSAGGSGGLHLPYNTVPLIGNTFDGGVSQALTMNFTQNVATGSMTVQDGMIESHRWE